MTDPYKVLGVSPNATDEDIKDAYRQLARKYHPDNYSDSPLADLATEKMKEINEAYDQIHAQRRGRSPSSDQSSQSGQGYQGSSEFADIRRMINNGRFAEAEELLDGVPSSRRNAEWYYLKGSLANRKGWLDAALEYFNTACKMDPGNQDYRAAYQRLIYQQQNEYTRGGVTTCNCCDICATAYCLSCCSNCFCR